MMQLRIFCGMNCTINSGKIDRDLTKSHFPSTGFRAPGKWEFLHERCLIPGGRVCRDLPDLSTGKAAALKVRLLLRRPSETDCTSAFGGRGSFFMRQVDGEQAKNGTGCQKSGNEQTCPP